MSADRFIIKDLDCSYPGRGKVMHIEELKIESGEVVFILGNSGSGKSTLIETLGLMAENIDLKRVKRGQIQYFPDSTGKPIDYYDIWTGSKRISIPEIRQQNFNFIFQDNNLMPNFLNVQNVALADLRVLSNKRKTSESKAISAFKAVNLSKNTWRSLPKFASGGERQRVAVTRGLVPDFNVLFGDEPTGNLDKSNSKELFKLIRRKIDEQPDRAAVIVSHDIDLAIEYADKIVVLSNATKNEFISGKPKCDNFYEVLNENIFVVDENKKEERYWKGKDGNDVVGLRDKITDIIENNLNGCIPENNSSPVTPLKYGWPSKLLHWAAMKAFDKVLRGFRAFKTINRDFISLFLQNEFPVLNGKFNFIGIVLAFLFSFGILAWANGKLTSLEYEMKNPFLLTIDVLHKDVNMIDRTKEFLNEVMADESTVDHYELDYINYYNRDNLRFFNLQDTLFYGLYGRTIDPDDKLLEKIMKTERFNPVGRKFDDTFDFGLIVTRDMLKHIGYNGGDSNAPPFVFIQKYQDSSSVYKVPVPIIGIVDELPGNSSNTTYFLMTTNFYDNYKDSSSEFIHKYEFMRMLVFLSPGEVQLLKSSIERVNEEESKVTSLIGNILVETNKLKSPAISYYNTSSQGLSESEIVEGRNLYEIIIVPDPEKPIESLLMANEVYDIFNQTAAMQDFRDTIKKHLSETGITLGAEEYYTHSYFSKLNTNKHQERGAISFLFRDGSKISDFAFMFKEVTKQWDNSYEGLSMDLTKVITANSFEMIGNISLGSLLLIIILIMAILLYYVYNLINVHLFRVQKNIGTLMAFGVNIKSGYYLLIISFISVAFLIPFLMVSLTELIIWLIGLFYTVDLGEWVYFSLFKGLWGGGLTILTVLIVIGGVIWVLCQSNKKYFKLSPSELIYGKKG